MQIQVRGNHMDVGNAFTQYIEEQLTGACEKYFSHAVSAQVSMQPDSHSHYKSDILISVGNGIVMQASAVESEPYASFDASLEKIGRQLRKYKDRLQDHHTRMLANENQPLPAAQYVIEAEKDDAAPTTDEPVIIAEMQTSIDTLSVSEAVMRMDLAGVNAMLFRNRTHNGLNMVYRRNDGNIGWIDPEGNNK